MVLDALLDNAAKFAPGSLVEVSLRPSGDEAVLTVRTTVRGCTPRTSTRWAPGSSGGREHQNIDGTGLGLAIVRARVEDFGGSFAVGPADGGGLAVRVGLPLT